LDKVELVVGNCSCLH